MKPVQRRLMLLIIGVILFVSFLSLSYINYISARNAIREELITSSLPLTRENIYSEILKDLIPPLNIASLMANDTFLIDWTLEGEKDRTKIIKYLQEIQQQYGYFSTFFVSNKSKNYYHYSGLLKTVSIADEHDIWYYDFIGSEKHFDLDVDTNEASGHLLTIFVNYRVEDYNGDLLGVTGVGLKMENFSNFLSATQQKYHRRIYLVDEKGIVQAHSDISRVDIKSLYENPQLRQAAEHLLEKSSEPVYLSYSTNSGQVLVTSRYMPEINWFLIVEQDEAEALKSARTNLMRTLIIGLFTTLILLTISGIIVSRLQRQIEHLAATDKLTDIPNRREFEERFERAKYRQERYHSPLSILIIDIDNFKTINDTQGHLSGDWLLQNVAQILRNNIRPTDIIARWGGDEFIILTESNSDQALQAAERLMAAIKAANMNITLSIGITEFHTTDTSESAIQRADKALYQSKKNGKNRITTA